MSDNSYITEKPELLRLNLVQKLGLAEAYHLAHQCQKDEFNEAAQALCNERGVSFDEVREYLAVMTAPDPYPQSEDAKNPVGRRDMGQFRLARFIGFDDALNFASTALYHGLESPETHEFCATQGVYYDDVVALAIELDAQNKYLTEQRQKMEQRDKNFAAIASAARHLAEAKNGKPRNNKAAKKAMKRARRALRNS